MFGLSQSEMLLYGGIILMAVSALSSGICIAIFRMTGKKIEKKLEQDYGRRRL